MSDENVSANELTANGYSMTAWILGIVALLMTCTNVAAFTPVFLAILGLIFAGIGLSKIEKVDGKKTFTIVTIVINIIALLPFLF